MNNEVATPKSYKVDVKYIVYILLFLVLILLVISLSFGYLLLNIQKDYEKKLNSSVSASLLASKQNEETSSVLNTETATSSSEEKSANIVWATNNGTYVSFDYPEDATISIESIQPNDKFTNVEDIKYIHLKGDFYEVTFAKNKNLSLNQSTVGEKMQYIPANLEGNCKYLLKGASLDKVLSEILCDEGLQVTKSRLLTPGFSYFKSKPIILLANSNDANGSIISFTSFGSPLGMREIIAFENIENNSSNNIYLQNMPASWKNSAYFEFRCNNISDEEIANKCIEIFTNFIDSFEFVK